MKTIQVFFKDNEVRQNVWIFAIITLALIVRLIGISNMPFTTQDASLAADALAMAKNEPLGSSALPAYTGLTSLLFYVFGPSDFLARMVPLLAGLSIVCAAFLYMKRHNIKNAMILAFALSLDWFMVSMSRQLNTPLIALAGFVWTYYFFEKRKIILTGFFLAIAFLGGYFFWVILLGILVVCMVNHFRKPELKIRFNALTFMDNKAWAQLLLSFLISTIMISTGFFLKPSGFGTIGSGLLLFFDLITQGYQLPFYHVFFVIAKYMLVPLVGAILLFYSKNKDEEKSLNWVWKGLLVFGLLMTIFLSRQDLGSAFLLVIPLWILGVHWFSTVTLDYKDKSRLKMGTLIFFVVLMVYVGMIFSGFINSTFGSTQFIQMGIAVLAGVLLIMILIWLGSLLFETRNAFGLFVCALITVLVFVSMGQTFRSLTKQTQETQSTLNHGPVLFSNPQQWSSLDIFERYARINTLETSFHVEGVDHDIRWQLRNYRYNQAKDNPDLILSFNKNLPKSDLPYRGMRVELSRAIPWKSMDIKTYLKQLINKNETWHIEGAFLWAQTKLFSGANE